MTTHPRSLRLAACGLLLGVATTAALAGLLGAAAAHWPSHVADQSRIALDASSDTEPADAASSQCRMVSGDFAADPGNPLRAWGRLRNVGPVPVTLSAVELGWRGPAVLQAVLLRQAGDETSLDVHDGPATSPALLFLQERKPDETHLVVPAGSTVELGLLFADAVAGDLPGIIGPTIVHAAEGCAVALNVGADVPSACRLSLGTPALAGTTPNQVDVPVNNNGDEPLDLATVELTWPEGVNGPLTALVVDGKEVLRFEKPVAASPTVIDLRRLGASRITIGVGKLATLGFAFEQPAAAEPYSVAVTTRGGCTASTTTWIDGANSDCGATPVGFEFHGDTAQLRLANQLPVTRTLAGLDVFWPVAASGPLSEVRVNGSQVWRGEESRSPASVSLTGALIPPASTVELQLVFTSTVKSSLALQGGSGGDYSVVASFNGGCQAIFSTITGRPSGCSLSASDLVLDPNRKEISTRLTSLADDAALRLASIKWPARNGALVAAWLDTDVLFTGEEPPGTRPFEIRLAGQNAVVPRSQSRDFGLRFADRVSRGGYVLSLTFEDPAGTPCELMVQSVAAQPDCRLSLGALRTDLRNILIPLRNEGQDEVEIRYLDVDWPTDGVNGLSQVALVDDESQPARVIWAPDAHESVKMQAPARVVPNGDGNPIVDSGVTTTLRLRFTDMMDSPHVAERFRLTVGAVEGCVATYAPDGSRLPAKHVSFGGVIRQLPSSRPGESGLFGIWRIESEGAELLVQVDAQTRFTPSTVTPAEGDIVGVEALRTDDGKLLAEEITFRNADKGTTLIGTVDAVDGASARPTWIDVRIATDVQKVRITDTTVIDGELAVGAAVTVEGTVNPTEGVTASRITVTSPPQGEFVLVRGVIQRAEPGQTSGEQKWVVDKYQVRVPRAYAPDTVPAGSLPAEGQRVEVFGRLTAREIVVVQKPKLLAVPRSQEIEGYLRELPPNSLIGGWAVESEDGQTYRFLVGSLAVIDTNVAPADLGLWVRAVLQESPDGLVALRIRMDWQR